jgi:dihydroxy-acid dehydratase
LKNGDIIVIDAVKNSIDVKLSAEEIQKRIEEWQAPPLKVTSGSLYKYAKTVASASEGCVTDEF